MSLPDWHQRYQSQVEWSQEIREHLFAKLKKSFDAKILEVGSGTGALLEQIHQSHPFVLSGVDIDWSALRFSQENLKTINLIQADAYHLPYPQHIFDLTICHFLLLWAQNPHSMLLEMRRVTRRGGFVIALAEPDHEARIDFPPDLGHLGQMQTQALQQQGADTQMGRKLGFLFSKIGLEEIETGILGAQWEKGSENTSDETEWEVLRSDLGDRVSEDELQRFRQMDHEAFQAGSRVLFVPTFYAIGKV